MSQSSPGRKSYRTSAILFVISGMVFLILTASGGRIYFLPIGIALVIVGLAIWQKSREQNSSSK